MTLVTIPETEVLEIHSDRADADYQLWIARPVAGHRPLPEAPLPVLWVLDANLFFGTAVESARLMHQLFHELPPMLVVGVGYDTTSPAVQAELRARDFTPTADSGFGPMAQNLPGAPAPTLPPDRRLGRAPEFLNFLTAEALPLVEERYRVDPEQHVLFGSSLGGLFVLYALLQGAPRFARYIAVSPALWWDGGKVLQELAEEPDTLRRTRSAFLAAGGLEERADLPMLASFRMITNTRECGERLRRSVSDDARVEVQVLEGETHTTVVPVGLTRGLRFTFGGQPEVQNPGKQSDGSPAPTSSPTDRG